MNSLDNFVESLNRTVYDFSTLAKSAGVIYIGFAVYDYFFSDETDKEWEFKKTCIHNKTTIYENENFIYCYSDRLQSIEYAFDKEKQELDYFPFYFFKKYWKQFFDDI